MRFNVGYLSGVALLSLTALFLVAAGLLLEGAKARKSGIPNHAQSANPRAKILIFFYLAVGFLIILTTFSTLIYWSAPSDFQPLVLLLLCLATIAFIQLTNAYGPALDTAVAIIGAAAGFLFALDELFRWEIFGSRHSAMFLLVPLVVLLAKSRINIYWLIPTIFASSGVVLTGSRTATAIVVFLVFWSAITFMRESRPANLTITFVTLISVGSIIGVYAPVRNRFFAEPGDRAINISLGLVGKSMEPPELVVNSNGRIAMWDELLASLPLDRVLWGNGSGFTRRLLSKSFGETHPHNEYIRVLVDFGMVGLILVLAVLLLSFFVIAKCGGTAISERFARVAALFCICGMALTDLPWVSLGVVLPFSISIASARSGALKEGPK